MISLSEIEMKRRQARTKSKELHVRRVVFEAL